jgi:hypothetical protein
VEQFLPVTNSAGADAKAVGYQPAALPRVTGEESELTAVAEAAGDEGGDSDFHITVDYD